MFTMCEYLLRSLITNLFQYFSTYRYVDRIFFQISVKQILRLENGVLYTFTVNDVNYITVYCKTHTGCTVLIWTKSIIFVWWILILSSRFDSTCYFWKSTGSVASKTVTSAKKKKKKLKTCMFEILTNSSDS